MGENPRSAGTAQWKLRFAAAAAAVVGAAAAVRVLPVQEFLRGALEWIGGLGAFGGLLCVALYIGASVFFVPGSLLTLGAGAVYGVVKGAALASVASTLGATAAFLVGRYLARDWVARKIEGNARFRVVDEAVAREGWKIVGLTRLSPIFPFIFLNYAYGLTRVTLRDYFFASWVGMIPGTVLYVYLGSLAGELARLGAAERKRDAGEWALYAVGLTATLAVTVYVTRIARSALAKKV